MKHILFIMAALLVAACTPIEQEPNWTIVLDGNNTINQSGLVGAWDDTKSAGSTFTSTEYNTMVAYIKNNRAAIGSYQCSGTDILYNVSLTGSSVSGLCRSAGTGTITGTGLAPSGNVYKVALFDSTGSIVADASLCYDITNNYLGVGTCTPGSTMDVNGNFALGGSIPLFNQDITGVNEYTFYDTYSNGGSGASRSVNWATNGGAQSIILDAATTFTFTAPTGDARLMLIVKQDATGGRTASWPANVKWVGGSAPTLTSTANAVDMVTCWYDGTNYFCGISQNFA